MLLIGQPQNMGRRTMLLTVARHTTFGFVLFLISGILAFVGPFLAVTVTNLMTLGGTASKTQYTTVSDAISNLSVMALLGSVILILVGMIIAIIQYRNHVFLLEEFSLKFRRGIFDKTEVSIPYRQIQDINLVRTVMHRIFGVSRLLMITAGREDDSTQNESDTIFDPIDADLAAEIQHFLEHKIGVQVIERIVQPFPQSGPANITVAEATPTDNVPEVNNVPDNLPQ